MLNIKENVDYKLFGIKIFTILILTKCIYVISEYLYNLNILEIASSHNFYDEFKINELNEIGHIISSIGISLLITPFFYFIFKKISDINKKYFFYSITFLIIFFSSYYSLNRLVDYVVEKNLNKSYEAYYLNLFKVGLRNNLFEYNSFIKNDNIINDKLTIEEKLLFINSFILLNADDDLLNRLKEKGKEKFLEIYVDQHKNDFNIRFQNYMTLDYEIENRYIQFKNEKKRIESKLNQSDNIDIDKEYTNLINYLNEEYEKYLKNVNKNKNLINDDNKLKELKDELDTYLGNKTKYESYYRNKMETIFGRYVDPENFLDNNGKSNIMKIKNFFRENINEEELSFEEFKLLDTVKKEINKKLKGRGFSPKENVDYTNKSNFFNLINNAIIRKQNNIEPEFKKELFKKLGKNDLTLDMNYEKFINSQFVKSKIESKLKDLNLNKNKINDIIFVLNTEKESKENTFKHKLYINEIKESKIIDKYKFEKEDFINNDEAKEYGKIAIKLLYIPIFALIVSVLSFLLNLISVVSVGISIIFKLNLAKKIALNTVLITSVISLPLFNNSSILDNNIIKTAMNNDLSIYINLLNWITYYEKLMFLLKSIFI